MVESNTIEALTKALSQDPQNTNNTYNAVVSRVDNENVVWVHVAGSDKETPTASTSAEVKQGDSVMVEWRNNKLYIAGNYSNPSAGAIRVNAVEIAAQVANEAAQSAVNDAGIAREAAESVKGIAQEAKGDAAIAKTAANTSLTNLSQVQNVLDVVNWVAAHGTYIKATSYVEGTVYYTVTASEVTDPTQQTDDLVSRYYELDNGIYVKTTDTEYDDSKTYYIVTGTPVPSSKSEDIGLYYTLYVNDAMGDYIQSHLALTSDGLYVMADGSDWKVLIDDEGVYIVNPDNEKVTKYMESITLGKDDGTQSYLFADYHSLQMTGRGEVNPFVYFSDLRDMYGYAEFQEKFIAIEGALRFEVSCEVDSPDGYTPTVTVNSQNVPFEIEGQWFIVDPLSEGDVVIITYKTSSIKAKAYSLGVRKIGESVGGMSFTEGYNTTASGFASHAEGYNATASGHTSHAEGYNATASGYTSHAEGINTTASGHTSHAEGTGTTASGFASHAEGTGTTAEGYGESHAEGRNTIASGGASHAEGVGTIARQYASHAQNAYTIAGKTGQTALGTYNIEDTSREIIHPSGGDDYGKYAVIIGNGAYWLRSNALTVAWDGTATAYPTDKSNGNGFTVEHGIANKSSAVSAKRTDTNTGVWLGIGAGGINHGVYSSKLDKWLLHGDASNVYVNGINTNNLAQKSMFAGGSASMGSIATNSYADKSVSFGKTFASTPNVTACLSTSGTAGNIGNVSVSVFNISTTGCTIRVFNNRGSSLSPAVQWIAVGV